MCRSSFHLHTNVFFSFRHYNMFNYRKETHFSPWRCVQAPWSENAPVNFVVTGVRSRFRRSIRQSDI